MKPQMRIYIPTRGRVNKQVTLGNLPPQLAKNATLVVDASEAQIHHRSWPKQSMLVCPPSYNTIGKVRQYIVEQHKPALAGSHLIMLDDDLRFAARRVDDPTKFLPATEQDVLRAFKAVDNMLDFYPNVGIAHREGANRRTEQVQECTRLLRALAYDVTVLRKKNIRFDRLIVMEDFDVALQLLRAGHKTAAYCLLVQDQGGSQAAGGCSTYRTMERQAEGARGLTKLHAPFVKLVEKTTKHAWEGGTRLDVTVQWKQAYESSQVKKLRPPCRKCSGTGSHAGLACPSCGGTGFKEGK
jgi:hypothetical protein